jgi:hypothetical protein
MNNEELAAVKKKTDISNYERFTKYLLPRYLASAD